MILFQKLLCQRIWKYKICKSASYWAAQLLLTLDMISKDTDLGVGGNIKFFYRSEFYTHYHKYGKSSPVYRHSNQVDVWNGFWDMIKSRYHQMRYDQIAYPSYIYQPVFFWMLEAHMIRICNVVNTIIGCTPTHGVFSNWPPRKNAAKPKI